MGLLLCSVNEMELRAIERENSEKLIPGLLVQGGIEKSNQQA